MHLGQTPVDVTLVAPAILVTHGVANCEFALPALPLDAFNEVSIKTIAWLHLTEHNFIFLE